jgi:hypothetical protein
MLAQSSAPVGSHNAKPEIYEDDEVKIAIPVSWTRVAQKYPEGTLVLAKDGYTLGLVYRAGHASPVPGGRFAEAFNIPWVPAGETADCMFKQIPQPASRILLFENILLDTADPDARKSCGIAKDLGEWVGQGIGKEFIGSQRWFAGYFTSGAGGFMFNESDYRDSGCFAKLYKLSSSAQKPGQLPVVGDRHLQRIIQESIDIVNSIHYKACAPRLSEPFHFH